eukprot:6183946-Pleurochrysis_carterae.AAC.5
MTPAAHWRSVPARLSTVHACKQFVSVGALVRVAEQRPELGHLSVGPLARDEALLQRARHRMHS